MSDARLNEYKTKIANQLLKLHHKTTTNPLELMVDDLFCDFGAKHKNPLTPDVREILREATSTYAKAVISFPFRDILGPVYEELSSRGHRSSMGQFFTPHAVSVMMAEISLHDHLKVLREKAAKNETMMISEPACGAGAMILAALGVIAHGKEPELIEYVGFVAVDKERLCARLCAIQVMCNLAMHNVTLGEFTVNWGDTLAVETYETIVRAEHNCRKPYHSKHLTPSIPSYFMEECDKIISHWGDLAPKSPSFPISL
ncbi:MAG: N-6 DNA methylase [Vibrio splendidus]